MFVSPQTFLKDASKVGMTRWLLNLALLLFVQELSFQRQCLPCLPTGSGRHKMGARFIIWQS